METAHFQNDQKVADVPPGLSLFVAEEFRLDQGVGKLRKVERHKRPCEAFDKSLFPLIKRYKTGAPDGHGRSSLAGAGFTQKQR